MPTLWPAPRLHAPVRPLPIMFPQTCPKRRTTWRYQSQLVIMLSDSIADLLTRIRNAQAVKKKTVSVPHSKIKEDLVKIMVREKYLKDYQLTGKKPKPTLEIILRYPHNKSVFTSLVRLSKPGRRVYINVRQLPRAMRGRGIIILSTSKGFMTARQAKKKNLGGEVICKIS